MVPIQFITQATSTLSHEESALIALNGGCRWIQLGFDECSDKKIEPVALRILNKCREFNATFIVESRVDLCQKIKADGVFLSKNDLSVGEARQKLGHEFLIGASVHSTEDIQRKKYSGADYLVGGPINVETSGDDVPAILTFTDYRQMVTYIQDEELRIPICASGNIALKDVPLLLEIGVNGICLTNSSLQTSDSIDTMNKFLQADE